MPAGMSFSSDSCKVSTQHVARSTAFRLDSEHGRCAAQ
jgi:hypothetical protein